MVLHLPLCYKQQPINHVNQVCVYDPHSFSPICLQTVSAFISMQYKYKWLKISMWQKILTFQLLILSQNREEKKKGERKICFLKPMSLKAMSKQTEFSR